MNKTFADRLATAMKLKGIKTASALSRDTGIERSYMYRLASGKIDNPHKVSAYLRTSSKPIICLPR